MFEILLSHSLKGVAIRKEWQYEWNGNKKGMILPCSLEQGTK
jgi:hypothetical protein